MRDTIQQQAASWTGRTAVDTNGKKIGTIDALYVDDVSNEPEWFAISTGWFGNHISFAPVAGAEMTGDDIRLPYEEGFVKDAPHVPADGHLDEAEEERLFVHYGRNRHEGWDRTKAMPADMGPRNRFRDDDATTMPADRDRTAARGTARDGDAAMTRSEEELRVDTTRRPTGVVRLHKWIETENVDTTVPVRKEKARLVREPVGPGDRVDTDFRNEDEEILLSEEEVTVDKRVVPKEKVRLEKDTVTENVHVDETLRKERIAVDEDARRRDRR